MGASVTEPKPIPVIDIRIPSFLLGADRHINTSERRDLNRTRDRGGDRTTRIVVTGEVAMTTSRRSCSSYCCCCLLRLTERVTIWCLSPPPSPCSVSKQRPKVKRKARWWRSHLLAVGDKISIIQHAACRRLWGWLALVWRPRARSCCRCSWRRPPATMTPANPSINRASIIRMHATQKRCALHACQAYPRIVNKPQWDTIRPSGVVWTVVYVAMTTAADVTLVVIKRQSLSPCCYPRGHSALVTGLTRADHKFYVVSTSCVIFHPLNYTNVTGWNIV